VDRCAAATLEAVEIWRGLVAGLWSLVDHIDTDGRRYLVAHRNDPTTPDPRALTERERQVVAYADLGQSNKLIAYQLGLSVSTVGVLLARAREEGAPHFGRGGEVAGRRRFLVEEAAGGRYRVPALSCTQRLAMLRS
jgi:hypothetical protein